MLICFLNIRGIIYYEFVFEGTTVNQTFYVEVLKSLIDAIRHKQGELWRDRSLLLHHENTVAHSLLQVLQFLAGSGISAMDNLLYSPDLAPTTFWLFPKLKSVLKESVSWMLRTLNL
jgi:hypothetical protein